MLHEELSEQIIGSFYQVYNSLGFGFLEKVYVNAFVHDLSMNGLKVKKHPKVLVYYEGKVVGEYYPDLVIEDLIIVEVKAIEVLIVKCELQLINYLKATKMEVGLLMNFGSKPEFKRKIFSNEKKQHNAENKYK